MIRFPILTILLLASAGCAAAGGGTGAPGVRGGFYGAATTGTRIRADQAIARANAMASAAASQVKRCYRTPRVPSVGRRIVTHLRVRYSADGMLEGAPQLLSQEGVTAENETYALPMAQAASMAVLRCTPLRLPAELHRGGWDNFDLTFSPRVLV
jgi:hypothetical protein